MYSLSRLALTSKDCIYKGFAESDKNSTSKWVDPYPLHSAPGLNISGIDLYNQLEEFGRNHSISRLALENGIRHFTIKKIMKSKGSSQCTPQVALVLVEGMKRKLANS